MVITQELTEYGLIIEDQHLDSLACECGNRLVPAEGKDWLYCKACASGVSRLERVSKSWKPSAICGEKLRVYQQAVIRQTKYAQAVWDMLVTGSEADQLFPRISLLKNFARVATEPGMSEALQQWSIGDKVELPSPAIVLKLEDAPGRITGFAVLHDMSPGAPVHLVTYLPYPAGVAFFQHGETALLNVADAGLLTKLQCRQVAMQCSLAPLAFARVDRDGWYPHNPGGYIMEADILDHQLLRTVASSNCLLRLRKLSGQPQTKLTPTAVNHWYNQVRKEAASWETTVANYFATVSPDSAAVTIRQAQLPDFTVSRILAKCSHRTAKAISSALSRQPASYRLSTNITVFDDGQKWTNHKGEVVLSGSLRVDRVAEDENGKPVYHCRVSSSGGTVLFECGKEFERDGLAVAMRKCLVQGISLSYMQSYSRHALQLAVGLHPVQRASVSDAITNLG